MKLLFHLLTSLTSAELSDQPKTLGKKGKVSLCKTYIPVTRKTGENVTGENVLSLIRGKNSGMDTKSS